MIMKFLGKSLKGKKISGISGSKKNAHVKVIQNAVPKPSTGGGMQSLLMNHKDIIIVRKAPSISFLKKHTEPTTSNQRHPIK
jgi:hypothetical protein